MRFRSPQFFLSVILIGGIAVMMFLLHGATIGSPVEYQRTETPQPVAAPAKSLTETPPATAGRPPAELMQWDPFKRDLGAAATNTRSPGLTDADNLRLTGLLTLGKARLAIVRVTGLPKPETVREGQIITGTKGVRVVFIGKRNVIVCQEGMTAVSLPLRPDRK